MSKSWDIFLDKSFLFFGLFYYKNDITWLQQATDFSID